MQKLRKVAISESQRKRNALLKTITANSIPAVDERVSTPPAVPAILKNKARKSIGFPSNGQGSGWLMSKKEESNSSTEQEVRIVTCSNDVCAIRGVRLPSVPCITCLRLFHRECLTTKGSVLPSLQFECNECAQFSVTGKNTDGTILMDEGSDGVDDGLRIQEPEDGVLLQDTFGDTREESMVASPRLSGAILAFNNIPAGGVPLGSLPCGLSTMSLPVTNLPDEGIEKGYAAVDTRFRQSPPLDMVSKIRIYFWIED